MTDKSDVQAGIVVGLVAMPAAVGAVLLRGWVLTRLWFWFVEPFGVSQLGIAQAIGLSLIAAMMTDVPRGKDDREPVEKIAFPFLMPMFTLFFGWIASRFL